MTPPEVSSEQLRTALKEAIKEELKEAELSNPNERKELFKAAAKEVFWEAVEQFTWWSIKTVAAAVGAAVMLGLVYLIAWVNGWAK